MIVFIEKSLARMASMMALLGGLVLLALIALTCLSIFGRLLNSLFHGWIGSGFPNLAESLLALGVGPITGDFELVEAGVAFTIFAFLPYCHLHAGHAVVDLIVERLPMRVKTILEHLIALFFAFVLILIAMQLGGGMLSKYRNGETSFLLGFPIWWSYAASFGAAIIAAIVASGLFIARFARSLAGEGIS